MNMPGNFVFQGKGLSKDGFSHHAPNQPKNVEQLVEQRMERPDAFVPVADVKIKGEVEATGKDPMRGPASVRVTGEIAPVQGEIEADKEGSQTGVNLFSALKKLQIALETNDKIGIQESLDRLDDGLQQVVVARAALGSKVSTIDSTLNAMATATVDQKQTVSQLEDADTFQVISDMNKTESALQASLQTSGKLLQKSLMDFVQV